VIELNLRLQRLHKASRSLSYDALLSENRGIMILHLEKNVSLPHETRKWTRKEDVVPELFDNANSIFTDVTQTYKQDEYFGSNFLSSARKIILLYSSYY